MLYVQVCMYLKYSYEACRNILILPKNLNINNLRTTSAKSINLHTIRTLIQYSFLFFALTVFEMLLSEGKSVLSPAQRGTGSEGVKVSVKNQKNIRNLLEMLEKWLTYKLRKFWMVFNFFWFCLTLSVPEKFDFWDANKSTNFKHQ